MNFLFLQLKKALNDFGILGLISYIGAIVLIVVVYKKTNFNEQLIFGGIGLILLLFSGWVNYLKNKQETRKVLAFIDCSKHTAVTLASKLDNKDKEQTVSITQTIWQNQKDLAEIVFNKDDKEK